MDAALADANVISAASTAPPGFYSPVNFTEFTAFFASLLAADSDSPPEAFVQYYKTIPGIRVYYKCKRNRSAIEMTY